MDDLSRKIEMLFSTKRDEMWAMVRDQQADILRIQREGVNGSEKDRLMVKAMFSLVLGELMWREKEVRDAGREPA
jgi:hypothetical protein